MAWMSVMGPCFACKKVFTFNAERVPSIKDGNGVRQPVCKNCMDIANAERERKGLSPHPILPEAYAPQEVA